MQHTRNIFSTNTWHIYFFLTKTIILRLNNRCSRMQDFYPNFVESSWFVFTTRTPGLSIYTQFINIPTPCFTFMQIIVIVKILLPRTRVCSLLRISVYLMTYPYYLMFHYYALLRLIVSINTILLCIHIDKRAINATLFDIGISSLIVLILH
jgi:hypothetical protein